MHIDEVNLSEKWIIREQLGAGGFGQVFAAECEGVEAAVKFVPKTLGGDRDLLIEHLDDVSNVIPILDSGETGTDWVIVMARAERSLREALQAGEYSVEVALAVLGDVLQSLVDLDGRIVHRDIKPENILFYDGSWCLADFGISRYAEATTAPDTRKYAWSPPYAAPERWREERATTATDVYSLGVVAYEILARRLPFEGPDFRQQHLHESAPPIEGVAPLLAALVDECMYRSPEARPSPANLLARLSKVQAPPASGGLAALQAANQAEIERRAAQDQAASVATTAAERRGLLLRDAERAYEQIIGELEAAIVAAAPAASVSDTRTGGRAIELGNARLTLGPAERVGPDPWDWATPPFEVVACSEVNLRIPRSRTEYEGRSHSLWFCDAQVEGEFAWFETAFMVSPMIPQRGVQDPFALSPGEEAGKAVWLGMAERQVAWPFTRLVVGDLEEFIDRWASWLAQAANGQLGRPSTMPERRADGSWRK